jgi:phospholipid/cholesterol/gamma-HCH transport system ATP-binding protein
VHALKAADQGPRQEGENRAPADARGATASGPPPTGSNGEILRVEGLRVEFGKKVVLDGLDLTLREGETLAILGKSGIGKSVLLKVITGLLHPTAGRVTLWGTEIDGLSEDAWGPLRRRMGMVFQAGALFDSMSVFENVAFPLRERRGISEEEVERIVRERLEWVELPKTEGLRVSELSGGMRRRLAVARTLAADPKFILYDEPTTGLDPVTGRKIALLMRDLDRKLGSTAIIVTHDIECARTVASRWAYLSQGRLVADGSPDDLVRSENPEVREFLLGLEPARDLPWNPSNT